MLAIIISKKGHTICGGKITALIQVITWETTNEESVSGKGFAVFDYKAKPEKSLKVKVPNPVSCPSIGPSIYYVFL